MLERLDTKQARLYKTASDLTNIGCLVSVGRNFAAGILGMEGMDYWETPSTSYHSSQVMMSDPTGQHRLYV